MLPGPDESAAALPGHQQPVSLQQSQRAADSRPARGGIPVDDEHGDA